MCLRNNKQRIFNMIVNSSQVLMSPATHYVIHHDILFHHTQMQLSAHPQVYIQSLSESSHKLSKQEIEVFRCVIRKLIFYRTFGL